MCRRDVIKRDARQVGGYGVHRNDVVAGRPHRTQMGVLVEHDAVLVHPAVEMNRKLWQASHRRG